MILMKKIMEFKIRNEVYETIPFETCDLCLVLNPFRFSHFHVHDTETTPQYRDQQQVLFRLKYNDQ